MGIIRNNVQLIGNVGQDPNITNLENGKKVARFSLATNAYFKDSNGERQKETNWHNIVAWGKSAEIIEKFAAKGKEIAVTGKLKSRTYTPDDGIQRYITEVEAREILLLGNN
ncbi:single-stranded DNA-binding protein [Arenibacter sp. BSSL-BM3]|uniref:Single-stranded DNA-binding protein n=1 Tax=Arenibacter arenosicollis TaxID=2762274 RepID=A0ABR7QR74_9FLAO|nr:single-stranded DNA-binding protein [Arenibacter arenosicollis]MBC8769676.1 single-stranded DNA-binding protein [Arenibacter arenosicollis]